MFAAAHEGREVRRENAARAAEKEEGRPSAQAGGDAPPGAPHRRAEGEDVTPKKGGVCQAAGQKEIKRLLRR